MTIALTAIVFFVLGFIARPLIIKWIGFEG